MSRFKIGIIGKGFVGSAVAHGFSQSTGYDAKVLIHDKDPGKSLNSLEEIVKESDLVFISVPTPSNKDGSINLSILENCIDEVYKTATKLKVFDPIYLIRSTIIPGTSSRLQKKYKNLKIVFNPEFLTERSAFFDFISQTRIVLGSDDPNKIKKVKKFINIDLVNPYRLLKQILNRQK